MALQKAVDVIAQTWKKIQEIDQEHQERKLEIQRKKFELEQEQLKAKREEFEWEEEHVKRKQKLIESSITTVVGIASTLHPEIDEQTREIIMQAMTPTCWKL